MRCCSRLLCRAAVASTASVCLSFLPLGGGTNVFVFFFFYFLFHVSAPARFTKVRVYAFFVFPSAAFNFLINGCSSCDRLMTRMCCLVICSESCCSDTAPWGPLFENVSSDLLPSHHTPQNSACDPLQAGETGKRVRSECCLHLQTGNCSETLFYNFLRSNQYQWGFWGE